MKRTCELGKSEDRFFREESYVVNGRFYTKVCNGVLSHLIKLGVFQKIKELDAALAEKTFSSNPSGRTD